MAKELPVFFKNEIVAFTKVSDRDYRWLKHYKFRLSKTGYVVTSIKASENFGSRSIFLHQMILPKIEGLCVDHIDRDRMNNVRSNLRRVTQRMNCHNVGRKRNNTSGFPNVSYRKNRNKWEAYVITDYIKKHLGMFDTPEAASQAAIEYKTKNKWYPPKRGVKSPI